MTTIQMTGIEPTEFAAMVADMVKANIPTVESVELLTQDEAAGFLKITPKTLIKWRDKGTVVGHAIESEVRYYKAELLAALRKIETKKNSRK